MTNNYTFIKIIQNENFLNIILNRPEKKNALNPVMINEISDILEKCESDNSFKIILITSSCNIFCAGADLDYLKKIKNFSLEENLTDSKLLMSLYKKMLKSSKLIISLVKGHAIAGGCGIACASDIIFASKDCKFGYPEVKIGFIPALVSTFLSSRINESSARDLLLSGKLISSKHALEIGLINYVIDQNTIDLEVMKYIEEISVENSTNSIKETKELLYVNMNIDKKLEFAAKLNAKNRKSKDFEIGINNFLNKKINKWN